MQLFFVILIIVIAAGSSVYLIVRRFLRPEECAKYEGCHDCPLLQNCKKKQ